MAGLEFSGSSTLGASQAVGGNGGIQFGSQGLSGVQIAAIVALAVVGFYIFTKKGK